MHEFMLLTSGCIKKKQLKIIYFEIIKNSEYLQQLQQLNLSEHYNLCFVK